MSSSPASRAADFAASMRIGDTFRFRSSASAGETVYASCFAAMIWHYDGSLARRTTPADRERWAAFINSFQDEASGFFNAPEIVAGNLVSSAHDQEHLLMHFCAHALPALSVLGARPRFPLRFAEKFAAPATLDAWLATIDWKRAWIEGNNLLFVGQFLLHAAEREGSAAAPAAVERLMAWLDREMDPASGLWGTNGFCDAFDALYGGYHQLLLYWYLERPHAAPEALAKTILGLQHFDGGFHQYRGGGTCQDVDAVDVLVNLHKRYDHLRPEIESSLQRARSEVRRRQKMNGGFVDRDDREFCHMGIEATRAPAGEPNLFSTWFGVHTLLLIDEIVGGGPHEPRSPFNDVCSMGWHNHSLLAKPARGTWAMARDSIVNGARAGVTGTYAALSQIKKALRR